MRLRYIAVSILLLIGAADTFAEPGGLLRDGRETVRAFFMQSTVMERAESQLSPQSDRRQTRGVSMQDSSGYSAQSEPNSGSNSSSEGRRQPARLTPEERRALRRQIDEAGHDIYSPKR